MRSNPALVAALLILLAAGRMASTFRVFSATVDEGTHMSASLEIYQFHQYMVQRGNPPVPRVVMGLSPYLGGMRFDPAPPWPRQLNTPFYDHGKYEHNLFLARVGNLFFFVLAALCVWFLGAAELGATGALLAVLLFTMEPIVLGYSALATHDAAALVAVLVPLLAFERWLRAPSLARALVFGAAYGFGIVCKLSAIAYVPLACIAITVVRLVRDADFRRRFPRAVPAVIPAAIVTLVMVWAGYGFAVGPRNLITPFQEGYGRLGQAILAHIEPETRIPAPNFFIGVAIQFLDAKVGILSYLCGETRKFGWWWYFPFAIALKTTLALLVLFVLGAFTTRGRLRWAWLEWTIAALVMVAVAMTSPLDVGVRYLLPAFALFALAGAATALSLLQGSRLARGVAIALLALQIGTSLLAHPDYFPYFNLLAGREPSRYLADSNLDWGQDVLRLRQAVRANQVDKLYVSVMTLADYGKLGFPPTENADPKKPVHGWLAVSEQSYVTSRIEGGWLWLPDSYQRIGKSIRLYRLP